MRKKISELETKDTPAPTDIIPIVDMSLVKRRTKKTTLGDIVELVDAVPNTQKGAPGGVATLTEAGKIEVEQLPAIAVTETFSVSSEAAMLALPAQIGDIAIRTDLNKTFILSGNAPSALNNWQEFLTPIGALAGLTDVAVGEPSVRAALVYDPDTQLWRSADIAKITDGGQF